jgi:hypothetical protein
MTPPSSSPRRNRQFDAVVAIVATAAILAVYFVWINPLSAPPAPPPPGLGVAWAGLPLSGYAESVYVTATSCSAPVSVRVDLFPPSAAFVSSRPLGEVAFAFIGDPQRAPLSPPSIYFRSRGRLVERAVVNTSAFYNHGYVFTFNPRETPSISAFFSARWTTPRTDGTCWLDIPGQIGDDTAALMANKLLGHSDWAGEALGYPVYHSDIYMQYNGASSALPVEPIDSLPAPARIDPPTWSCEKSSQTISTCETFAVLAHIGAEGRRTREIAFCCYLALTTVLLALHARKMPLVQREDDWDE